MKKSSIGIVFIFLCKSWLQAELELVSEPPATQGGYYQYLVASYQHSSGRVKSALRSYKKLLKANSSPHIYQGFFQLLFDMGQFKDVITAYEEKKSELEKIFDQNVSIKLILAQSYLESNQTAKSEELFAQLSKQHPDDEQVAYFAAISYLRNNQLENALKVTNQSLQNQAFKQKHFLFHFLSSKILIQQNKLAQALTHIEKSLELFPKFDRALLFKAVLQEQMGNINDAIGGYKQFLDLVGRDLPVEKQLTQLLFSQNRFGEALEYLKRIKINSPDYFFDLALIEFKAGNDKKALGLVEKSIKMDPLFTKAKLLKIEIFLQAKKITELLAFMRSWIISSCDDLTVFDTFLLLRKTGIPHAELIKTLLDIEKTKPHVNVVASLADLYKEAKDFAKAIEYYQKVSNQVQDQALKSKTLFQIGYLYFITKQTKNLEQTLQQALQCSSVYPSAYNLLAYHYAHANKDLPAALELIDKALAVAPHCYYYLDTKGYILFRQGQREQAISLYKRALELAPHDKVIAHHLKTAQGAPQ